MDYEAIARKAYEKLGERLYADRDVWSRDWPKYRDGWIEDAQRFMEAAGVPEMEKRLEAAEKVCRVAKAMRFSKQWTDANGLRFHTVDAVYVATFAEALREWEAVK